MPCPCYTDIRNEELYASSQLLTRLTGMAVQRNKAIVGRNAFSHEAGIHQDGVLKNAITYEIITPQTVGLPSNQIVLGKHSGRHALAKRYEELGYQLAKPELERAYQLFTQLADRKKNIYDEDLLAIVHEGFEHIPEMFTLKLFQSVSSTEGRSTATVELEKDGEMYSRFGDGGRAVRCGLPRHRPHHRHCRAPLLTSPCIRWARDGRRGGSFDSRALRRTRVHGKVHQPQRRGGRRPRLPAGGQQGSLRAETPGRGSGSRRFQFRARERGRGPPPPRRVLRGLKH